MGVPVELFRAAWAAVGPLLTLTARYESLPHATPVDTLPRTPAVRARAIRTVFDEVRRRSAPRGRFSGEQAHNVCQSYLLPAIEQVLRSRLATFDRALSREVAVRLNAAHTTRSVRNKELDHALAGPWAHNWHDYAMDDDLNAMATRALELLFEFVLAYPPTGGRNADERAVGELAALAELLLVTAGQDHGFARDLHGLEVSIDDDGVFVMDSPAQRSTGEPEPNGDSLDIDIPAYEQALRRTRIALARPSPDADLDAAAAQPDEEVAVLRMGVHPRVATDFKSMREAVPPLLAIVDASANTSPPTRSTTRTNPRTDKPIEVTPLHSLSTFLDIVDVSADAVRRPDPDEFTSGIPSYRARCELSGAGQQSPDTRPPGTLAVCLPSRKRRHPAKMAR